GWRSIFPICREATPMTSMRRDDVIWIVVVTLIAVTINPILKFIGLLPADVFRNLGISFPGQPQIVFGPLMAFLLLGLFLKTGSAMIFPVIGFLRALGSPGGASIKRRAPPAGRHNRAGLFSLSGMISLLAFMQTGEAIETGIVGADGLVGGDAAINGHGQRTVQMDGTALTMPK